MELLIIATHLLSLKDTSKHQWTRAILWRDATYALFILQCIQAQSFNYMTQLYTSFIAVQLRLSFVFWKYAAEIYLFRFKIKILQIGVFRQDKLYSRERSNKTFGPITRRIDEFFGENNTVVRETWLRLKQNITNE